MSVLCVCLFEDFIWRNIRRLQTCQKVPLAWNDTEQWRQGEDIETQIIRLLICTCVLYVEICSLPVFCCQDFEGVVSWSGETSVYVWQIRSCVAVVLGGKKRKSLWTLSSVYFGLRNVFAATLQGLFIFFKWFNSLPPTEWRDIIHFVRSPLPTLNDSSEHQVLIFWTSGLTWKSDVSIWMRVKWPGSELSVRFIYR